jgi:hypothetical protein
MAKARTGTITKKLAHRPYSPKLIASRIEAISLALEDIKAMPPALGEKWRAGMIRHYEKVLAELESYGNGISESK